MAALIPIAAVLGAGLVGIQWLFQQQRHARSQFWYVSADMLTQTTIPGDIPSERMTRHHFDESHTQRIHDLEVQPSLKYKEPLSQTKPEMRLLQLHSASEYDELIQCNLKRVDLGTVLPYTALSYCWGDARNLKIIVIDGQMVNVTENLYYALRELRSVGTEYVWADAICINQYHKLERHQQIQQMTTIYGRARIVFAWLGLRNPHFAGLKETFDKLKSRHADRSVLDRVLRLWLEELGIIKERQVFGKATQMAFPRIGNFLKRIAPGLSEDDRLLHANKLAFVGQLQSVLSYEYWRRAWILQELTVAGNIRLRCGDMDLDFELFSRTIDELEALHTSEIFQPFSIYHRHVANLVALRRKWRPREPIYLLSALRDSFHTLSTRPHDKIYSLFGVCFDSSRFVTVIDYGSSVEAVIRNMTRHSIQATRTLDIICMQSRRKNGPSRLPSWAPDWPSIGSHQFNNRMINYLTGLDEHQRMDPKEKYWRASSNSLYAVETLTADEFVLPVRGISVGMIKKCTGAVEESGVSEPIPSIDAQSSQRGLVRKVRESFDDRDRATNIFETLILYKPSVRADDVNCAFSDLWDTATLTSLAKEEPLVHAWLCKHRDFVIHGKPLIWWSQGKLNPIIDFEDRLFGKAERFLYHAVQDEGFTFSQRIKDLTAAVTRVLKDGLRLIETSAGTTGWAHPDAQPFDEVYLLEGCSMPVVLRQLGGREKQSSEYEVVGDAYLNGYMYGTKWPADGKGLVDIYLY